MRADNTAAATLDIPRRAVATTLELSERLIIGVLYAGLAYRLLGHFALTHNPADLLVLASESMVMVFVFIRRGAQEITLRPQDWALAFGASCATLLLAPARVTPLGPHVVGWTLQALGFAAQLWCKAHLFRNFGIAPALRGVAEKGPYALVRHPMYASYIISQIGFLYAFPTLWNAGVLLLWAGAQLMRIGAEERILRRSPSYQSYAARVRWRLAPFVY